MFFSRFVCSFNPLLSLSSRSCETTVCVESYISVTKSYKKNGYDLKEDACSASKGDNKLDIG